jgi:hypothetical protein
VKKEEPNEAEEPAADFVEENVIVAGSKEAAYRGKTPPFYSLNYQFKLSPNQNAASRAKTSTKLCWI